MPQFPIPDMGTLTSMADMMRRNRAQRSGAADAASIGQQMQSNLGRQAAIESDYAQRQDEISARATAYDVRGRERSEDFAHAELMQQRSIDAARDMQYGKQAFKLQNAGRRVGSAPIRPGGVPQTGIAPRSYEQIGGPRAGEQREIMPAMGRGEGSGVPQLFQDPATQQYAEYLIRQGEDSVVRSMMNDERDRNDPDQRIERYMGIQIDLERRRMEAIKVMDEALDPVAQAEAADGLAAIEGLIRATHDAEQAAVQQAKTMLDPDSKLNARSMQDVGELELQRAYDIVKAQLAKLGDKTPDGAPEMLQHLILQLRAMGYSNVSTGMYVAPARGPSEVQFRDLTKQPASHEEEVAMREAAAEAEEQKQAAYRMRLRAMNPTLAEEGQAGFAAASKRGVDPMAYTARHPVQAAATTYDEYGKPVAEGAKVAWHGFLAGSKAIGGAVVNRVQDRIDEMPPSLRYLFGGNP